MPYLKDFSARFFNDIEESNLKYIEMARKNGSCVKAENGLANFLYGKKTGKVYFRISQVFCCIKR